MTNQYKVFTLKLARQLCDQGFKVIGTVPNAKKPWLNVYIFENTEEFQRTLKLLREEYYGDGSGS